MFNINIKAFFSIIISKLIISLSTIIFKGGSNFPGKVALRLDKHILSIAAKGYKVILITGTNGKTTTTSMIYNMIKDSNKDVITNNTGANLKPGITACFIKNYKFKEKNDDKFAVIEVDEANLKLITEYISPKIIVITNLFRDQLDRYGEVYTTLNKILEGVVKVPKATLILNGDESLLGALDLPNPKLYYGFNCSLDDNKKIDINADAKFCKICKHPYEYNLITYNHLGDFFCTSCGYKRPVLDFHVDIIKDLLHTGSLVTINGTDFYINQPGTYNIYNGLCAYSVAKKLGFDNLIIFNSLKSQRSSFGRQEAIYIKNKEVKIILVKNPAGYDEAINTITLDNRPIDLAMLLNDNYADGRDVSWIWDVNFEKLKNVTIEKVMVSGIRLYDMATRLKIAGVDINKFLISKNYEELLKNIEISQVEIVYILATYTAMTDFRKFLHSKGLIKKIW